MTNTSGPLEFTIHTAFSPTPSLTMFILCTHPTVPTMLAICAFGCLNPLCMIRNISLDSGYATRARIQHALSLTCSGAGSLFV